MLILLNSADLEEVSFWMYLKLQHADQELKGTDGKIT